MSSGNIYRVALNSLSAHIAILDEQGTIIETNDSWREFAQKNGLKKNPSSLGVNYIEICEKASRSPNDEPAVIAQGIRKVISGDIHDFFINYPCHSPEKQNWFALRVVPLRDPKPRRVILTHENITPLVLVQRTLAKNEQLLQGQKEKLTESNIALKVLLKHREEDRRQLEDSVLANVRELVLPYVDRLLDANLSANEHTLAEIIRERLQEIISPFLSRLSALNTVLTPREIDVANLVREGRTSKEIAEILLISVSAVDFHRKRIRNKLNLSGSGKNLRSYLLSLR